MLEPPHYEVPVAVGCSQSGKEKPEAYDTDLLTIVLKHIILPAFFDRRPVFIAPFGIV